MKTSSFISDKELAACKKLFAEIDYYFALKTVSLNGESPYNKELFISALLVSYSLSNHGHICIDICNKEELQRLIAEALEDADAPCPEILECDFDDLKDKLGKSPIVGKPGDFRPLILDGSRLYLHKYRMFEQKIIEGLKAFCSSNKKAIDINLLSESLNRIFPISKLPDGCPDLQRLAAFCAVVNSFCIITGGPGTGKTTVTAAVLLLLQEQSLKLTGKPLKVSLCAPTGKAAARLSEAISEEKEKMKTLYPDIFDAIPDKCLTIHKLLGPIYLSPNFKHNAANRLDADVVVVDEASMAPAALMSKLFEALKDSSSLILLGDKDQLASVEAGAVFADICETAKGNSNAPNLFSCDFAEIYSKTKPGTLELDKTDAPQLLTDHVAELTMSHRFDPDRGIGKLKDAVNRGNSEAALKIAKNDPSGEISLSAIPDSPERLYNQLEKMVSQIKVGTDNLPFLSYIDAPDVSAAFDIFNRFRILCAHKVGLWGTMEINSLMTRIVKKHNNIITNDFYFKGLPLLINENQPSLGLYNGDVGLCWLSDTDGISVFFPDINQAGKLRSFAPAQLPGHETVFAMTVHKSQGSGFDKVLLILSGLEDSPILTRELIYTAITRARKNVAIWSSENAFKHAITKRTLRSSGISAALISEQLRVNSEKF